MRNAWIIGCSFIVSSLVYMISGGHVSQLEQVTLGVLTILLAPTLEKVRGILGWLLAFVVFAIHAVFGLVSFVCGLLPFLIGMVSTPSQEILPAVTYIALVYLPPLFGLILGPASLFHVVASERLNRYLGTEPIFTIGRTEAARAEEKAPSEKLLAEEIPGKLMRQVPNDLKDVALWLDERKYNTVARHLATVMRRKTLDKLGLVESSTNDEIVARLSELGLGVNLKMLSYVLNLGERCAFSKYQPTGEEAQKALDYSIELYSELST